MLRFVDYGKDNARKTRVLDALLAAMPGRDDETLGLLLGTILEIAAQLGQDGSPRILAGLEIAVAAGAGACRLEIARQLSFGRHALPDDAFREALLALEALPSSDENTAGLIDNTITRAIGLGLEDEGVRLLETLILRDGVRLGSLHSLCNAMFTTQAQFLSRLATRWLLDGRTEFGDALHDLALSRANNPPEIVLAFGSDLRPDDWAYLIRKAFAYLYIFPPTLLSITISIVCNAPDAQEHEVISEWLSTVLINYPAPAQAFIAKLLPSDDPVTQHRLSEATGALAEYLASLSHVPTLREFAPSETSRFIDAVRRHEQARAIQKNARSGSIFADIIPTSVLLYGDSAISSVFGADSSESRQEFRLSSFETRQDIARMTILDPMGFAYRQIKAKSEARPV